MRKVEHRYIINTKPEQVIKAFIDSEMLRSWWGVERSLIEPKIDGIYTICWNISNNGFGYVSSGIIKTYDPEGLLEIDKYIYLNPEKPILGPMSLSVSANPLKESSEVIISQEGYQEGDAWNWYYEAVKSAWPIVANNLKSYLEAL